MGIEWDRSLRARGGEEDPRRPDWYRRRLIAGDSAHFASQANRTLRLQNQWLPRPGTAVGCLETQRLIDYRPTVVSVVRTLNGTKAYLSEFVVENDCPGFKELKS